MLNENLRKKWNFNKNTVDIEKITSGSSKKVWWKCEKGHEWKASANQVKGCPYCSGHKVSKENSLAVVDPELSKE